MSRAHDSAGLHRRRRYRGAPATHRDTLLPALCGKRMRYARAAPPPCAHMLPLHIPAICSMFRCLFPILFTHAAKCRCSRITEARSRIAGMAAQRVRVRGGSGCICRILISAGVLCGVSLSQPCRCTARFRVGGSNAHAHRQSRRARQCARYGSVRACVREVRESRQSVTYGEWRESAASASAAALRSHARKWRC